MKTDDLVAVLAADLGPVDRARVRRRVLAHAAWGLVLAVLGMLVLLGPRPDLVATARLPMFWVKLAFPASLAMVALAALRRAGSPGMRLGWTRLGTLLPVAIVWTMAFAVLQTAPASERMGLVLGSTWRVCPLYVSILSVPPFVLALRSLRELAPTRLRLAGATAGLLAGATGALAYSVHCPELQAPFLAVWYLLGMLVPAGVGALLGPHVLRW